MASPRRQSSSGMRDDFPTVAMLRWHTAEGQVRFYERYWRIVVRLNWFGYRTALHIHSLAYRTVRIKVLSFRITVRSNTTPLIRILLFHLNTINVTNKNMLLTR